MIALDSIYLQAFQHSINSEIGTSSPAIPTELVHAAAPVACFMAALPLQDVAIALEVPDATTIPAAVAKLLRVVAGLPRLEAFVGQVCEVRLHMGFPTSGP